MYLRQLLCCIAVCFSVHSIQAQSPQTSDLPLSRYGIYGNLGLISHSADFRAFPGVPNCCPKFQSGSGTGMSFGVLYELPFFRVWWLSLRAGYEDYSAKLTTREPELFSGGIQGEFEHRVTTTLSSFGLESMILYSPVRNLRIGAGIRAATVLSKEYSQVEVIVSPADQGVFSNGKSTRNDTSGTIPNANSIAINLLAGISYDLPLNASGTLFLTPGIQYSLGLLPIISEYDWKANSLQFGIAFKYSPKPSVDTPPEVPKLPEQEKPVIVEKTVTPPVVVKKKPNLTASISAVRVATGDIEQPIDKITIEEFASTALHPLLQYVFFEENSSEIPSKYLQITQQKSDDFSLRDFLGSNSMDVYYSVLNVVGYRMKTTPKTTVTLTGCNSNEGNELNNATLSRNRAESIKKYLVEVWGINGKRIKIEQRNLPTNPSNSAIKEGNEENRRVEISSNDGEIITPIIIDDTIRRVSTPVIRFLPKATAEAGLSDWTLTATQQNGISTAYNGTSILQPSIDWNISKQIVDSRLTGKIDYTLSVRDTERQVATSSGQIQVEQVTIQKKRDEKLADKLIDRYSLILFDFDKADLDRRNQSIISFIKKRITPDASVFITGYTDVTGDEEHNRRLAQQRAAATAQALNIKATVSDTQGEQQFPNTTPEGRFYNRTVEILVETAVK
ncbi:MAG: OmpA family protein [Ignavibacteria bacterium]|nr:OmpA family protein [Ignavibacteria bacterium]